MMIYLSKLSTTPGRSRKRREPSSSLPHALQILHLMQCHRLAEVYHPRELLFRITKKKNSQACNADADTSGGIKIYIKNMMSVVKKWTATT